VRQVVIVLIQQRPKRLAHNNERPTSSAGRPGGSPRLEITDDRHTHPHQETSIADVRNIAGNYVLRLKKKLRGNWVFRVAHTVRLYYLYLLLGSFAKLRKATLNFVMFACLSVRMDQITRLPCSVDI